MKKRIIIILLLFLSIGLKSQPCINFHKGKQCRVTMDESFKLFSQSKSAMIETTKTYKYQVILFGGYDYKIGLCTESGFEPIHFRIINAEDQTVFFDNEDEKYIETIGFSNEETKKVIFEITLLATDLKVNDERDTRACLGIAIFWSKIPKLGI